MNIYLNCCHCCLNKPFELFIEKRSFIFKKKMMHHNYANFFYQTIAHLKSKSGISHC